MSKANEPDGHGLLNITRVISVPPGWWWRQDAAAQMEAERASPLSLAEVDITVKRRGIWRPSAPAEYDVVIQKASDATLSKRHLARATFWVGFSKADALLLGCAGALVLGAAAFAGGWVDQIAASQGNQRNAYAPYSEFARDLQRIQTVLPTDARIVSLHWTPTSLVIHNAKGADATLADALSQNINKPVVLAKTGDDPKATASKAALK